MAVFRLRGLRVFAEVSVLWVDSVVACVRGVLLFMVLIELLRLIQKWAATVDDRPADGNYSSSEAR